MKQASLTDEYKYYILKNILANWIQQSLIK